MTRTNLLSLLLSAGMLTDCSGLAPNLIDTGAGPAKSQSLSGGLTMETARQRAESWLNSQGKTTHWLVSVSGTGLGADGTALPSQSHSGWAFTYRLADGGQLGVNVESMATPQTFTVSSIGTGQLVTKLVAPSILFKQAAATETGPYSLTYLPDPEHLSSVAQVGNDRRVLGVFDAGTGTPYVPIRAEVGSVLDLWLVRVHGAYYVQKLNPTGLPAVPVRTLIQQGLLDDETAQAIDRNGDQLIQRSEYETYGRRPVARYAFHCLVANTVAYAAGEKGYIAADQNRISISLGAKYDPARPSPALSLELQLTPAAFRSADLNGDGRLSPTEAMVPIVEAIGVATLQSPQAVQAAVTAFDLALPWAH